MLVLYMLSYIAESVLEFDIEVVWQAVRNPFTRLHYDVLIKVKYLYSTQLLYCP